MMERTAGFEPAFSTPITVHRFVAGVGYVRVLARRRGFQPRSSSLRGKCPGALDDRRVIWLPDQDSNLDWPVNSRVSYHWTIGKWWTAGVPPPARRSCKDHLHHCTQPVPCRGFDPHSPALQAGAFTRLAYRANWSGQSVTIRRLLPGGQKLCH